MYRRRTINLSLLDRAKLTVINLIFHHFQVVKTDSEYRNSISDDCILQFLTTIFTNLIILLSW